MQALREAKAQGLCRYIGLSSLARATGISIAALTVRFLIANKELSTILVGASTPEELEESVVAAQVGPLPPDIQQTLEEPERL